MLGSVCTGASTGPGAGAPAAGLLIDADDAGVVSGLRLPGDPVGQRPVPLLLERDGPLRERVAPVLAELTDGTAVVVVAPEVRRDLAPAVRAFGLSRIRDAGSPASSVSTHRATGALRPVTRSSTEGDVSATRRSNRATPTTSFGIHILTEALSSG